MPVNDFGRQEGTLLSLPEEARTPVRLFEITSGPNAPTGSSQVHVEISVTLMWILTGFRHEEAICITSGSDELIWGSVPKVVKGDGSVKSHSGGTRRKLDFGTKSFFFTMCHQEIEPCLLSVC